jgi:hypothetical protein
MSVGAAGPLVVTYPLRKCGMTSRANRVIDCFTSAGSISPPLRVGLIVFPG